MKKLLATFLLFFVLNICTFSAGATTLPILLYHNITEDDASLDLDVHITRKLFKSHLNYLYENNYNTITLRDYYDYRVNGTPLPENPVIITFDDGYISNYETAYPLLKDYGFKATIFMVTDFSYNPYSFSYPHFTYSQAKEMEESGVIDIESHSASHSVHNALNAPELLYQVRKSYADLYFNLNKIPFAYAYPTGAYSELSKNTVKDAGYKIQLTVQGKLNNDDTPLDELKRLNIRGDCTVDVLKELILNSPF